MVDKTKLNPHILRVKESRKEATIRDLHEKNGGKEGRSESREQKSLRRRKEAGWEQLPVFLLKMRMLSLRS